MKNEYLRQVKENYDIATKNRKELVKKMEDLDDKLSILNEELKQSKNAENKIIETKKWNSKLLKKQLKTSINAILISLPIVLIIDMFLKIKFSIFQVLTITLVNLTANIIPYFFFKKNIKKIQTKSRTIEEIEKEYGETLVKRMTLGSKYKKIRDTEVLNEKIYKYTEEKFKKQDNNKEDLSINTKDIFWKIKLDSPLNDVTKDEKIKILNQKLKEYLQDKIIEKYNNGISKETLESFNVRELLEILTRNIPSEKQKEILTNIIHAMLGLISNVQEYSVIWSEQTAINLIQEPKIKYNQENMIDELITHKNTDYIMLFDKLYDTFISLGFIKEKVKTKKKS